MKQFNLVVPLGIKMHWCCKEHDMGLIISQFNGVVCLMGCTTKICGGATRNVVHQCVY
jgi:hypothetical protein